MMMMTFFQHMIDFAVIICSYCIKC